MKRFTKFLCLILMLVAGVQCFAQRIDSVRVARSKSPHELYVRMAFPDSGYYVCSSFHRVATMYPPANIVTFFYRKCDFVKASPAWDTTIAMLTPEPYKILVSLVRDSNTVTPGCDMYPQLQNTDTVLYDSKTTSVSGIATVGELIRIFPNPAVDVLHIIGGKNCELRITDIQGRMQLHQMLDVEQAVVDISTLSAGVYYVQCYSSGQLLQSRCFNKTQ